MRVLLVPIAAPLAILAFATPTLAHDVDSKSAMAAQMLSDPGVQEGVADSVSDAVSAMLGIRVGALERAANPFSNARRSDTLRDHLDRDDPGFEDRIHRRARYATRAAGVMAGEFAGMIPELRARLARVKHRLRDGGYDAGYDGPPPGAAPDRRDDRDETLGDWDD